MSGRDETFLRLTSKGGRVSVEALHPWRLELSADEAHDLGMKLFLCAAHARVRAEKRREEDDRLEKEGRGKD